MLRVVVSIMLGRITPSMILRRLGTFSRKNKLYFAFRELGRVIRTLFQLDYISDVKLRRSIHAATNKSVEFNNFVKLLFFGGEGVCLVTIPDQPHQPVRGLHAGSGTGRRANRLQDQIFLMHQGVSVDPAKFEGITAAPSTRFPPC